MNNKTKRDKMRAFELRYQGMTYKKVSLEDGVGYSDRTLRTNFTTIWKKEFENYCKTMNEIRDKEARMVLAGNVANAAKTIARELMADESRDRRGAANDILNRQWGKPKESINGSLEITHKEKRPKNIKELEKEVSNDIADLKRIQGVIEKRTKDKKEQKGKEHPGGTS